MANTLQLTIEVDDKGTIKVKQFADEAKKAFKEMEDGPKRAVGPLSDLRDSWIGVTAKIGIATAAIYAAKKVLYDFPASIASATNEIERQAGILGISTDEFQKWQYAAKMGDVNAQEFGIGLKMLSRYMEDAATGSGDASKYLSAMGISIKTADGHLKPLNQTMLDIADKFAMWEDGPRKIAIAMQLFGRSGETLIPILSQGRAGIESYWREAEKFGFIIDKNVLRAGSEAEDIFKKLSMQWQIFKLNLAPTALEIGKFLDQISPGAETIKNVFQEINRTIADSRRLLEGLGVISPKVEIPRQYLEIKGPKVGPPIIEDYSELLKKSLDEDAKVWGIYADDQLSALEKMNTYQIENVKSQLKREDWAKQKIIEGEEELEKIRIEAWAAVYTVQAAEDDEWVKAHEYALEKIKEGEEEFRKENIEAWEAYNQYLIDTDKETSLMGETLAKNMASAWNFNLKNIITDSQNMGDAVRKVFFGMSDAFTSAISKMISDWMLFGSVTGKYESGKGLIGLLGGELSSLLGGGTAAAAGGGAAFSAGEMAQMVWLQHGADFWATKPMIIGVGEGGRERVTVTPENKMGKMGGNTYNYNIDARGAQKGVSKEILRALRETENRAVRRSVNEVADCKMRGGKFAKIFE